MRVHDEEHGTSFEDKAGELVHVIRWEFEMECRTVILYAYDIPVETSAEEVAREITRKSGYEVTPIPSKERLG